MGGPVVRVHRRPAVHTAWSEPTPGEGMAVPPYRLPIPANSRRPPTREWRFAEVFRASRVRPLPHGLGPKSTWLGPKSAWEQATAWA